MRANGEDRAIRQPDGLSDMQELVTQGGNVVMILVTARNRLGERCRLIDWVQILTGEPEDRHQYPAPAGREDPAAVLRPGHIVVYLTLTYRSPGAGRGDP